jgi:NAD(P)H-dependent FMN reductase
MNPIVSITGTARPGNFTQKALYVVNDELEKLGHQVLHFDPAKLTLGFPGQPETDDAKRLRHAILDAPGVVLGTPEYHGTFAAMTKLIIENLGFPSALSGKPMALLGVAAGRIGAIKSLEQLKGVCSHVGALVVPGAVSIAGIQRVFDAEGRPADAPSEQALRNLARALHDFLRDYVCPKHTLEAMVRSDAVEPWPTAV